MPEPRARAFVSTIVGASSGEFPIRTVQCACGGWFTAGGSSDNVARAIRAHADTRGHQAWRERKEGD